MSARTAGRVAWGLTALSVLLFAVSAALGLTRGPVAAVGEVDLAAQDLVFQGAFTVFAAAGALIVSRSRERVVGWLFVAVGLATSLQGFAFEYAIRAVMVSPGSLPAGPEVGWVSMWLWASGIVFLCFLLLLFPNGRFHSRAWRAVGWAVVVASGLLIVGALALWPQRGRGLLVQDGVEGTARMLVEIAFLSLILLAGLSIVGAVVRFIRSRGEQRLQLKWFAYAVMLLGVDLAVSELDLVPPTVLPYVDLVAILAIPVAVAIAVLKYRLYDIDLVINKTLVYGALAAFITAVYVGVVVGIGTLVGTRGDPNLGLQVAATALVAVAFQPVRARVQHLANRLVYGRRATPYEVMAAFGARMAGSIEVEEVLPRTAEAAARGVGASRARVGVFLPDGTLREAHWPEQAEGETFDVAFPVTHQEEEVGEIAVAKPAGDPLRPSEEALLRDLASQAGLALHNVRLTTELRARVEEISRQAAELRASQARIVTAAADERRRLERAMEDRVERRLDQVAASLREVVAGEGSDGAAVAARLESLRTTAQQTLEDLREIARGIYPPLLADRGLTAAVEAQVRRSTEPVRLSVNGLRRYPEEVEAGVYFCCLEAIRGSTAGLELDVRDEGDAIRLGFDGQLSADALTRIRDRVEALGAALEHGEATVRAVIPARALEAV